MKILYKLKLTISILLVFIVYIDLFSCNLSNYTLTSITGTGPYTIVTRLCVGYGRTGSINGADADTRDILFGFYSSNPAFAITSFSPSSITSGRGFSNCTMNGLDIGSVPFDPFNSQGNIYYADPGTAPCTTQPFACVTSTALCGNVNQQCINFTFVTNILPDSIKVFGVEGAGNPVAGCFPNPDMQIKLNGLLPVFWSTVSAKKINDSKVAVYWTTLSEMDNYFFTVEKTDKLAEGLNHHNQQTEETVWTQCGIVNGTNKNTIANYTFTDNHPFPGLSYYRIKQTDFSGKFSYSPIVVTDLNSESDEIKIFPNPSKHTVTVEYAGMKSISLLNMFGEKIYEESNLDTHSKHSINTQTITAGVYLLKIKNSSDDVVSSKIIITH